MEKTHDSDLVFMFVRPKFRLLESWNDWIEYIDNDFWILIRVVERLKVFDDLEKLFCIATRWFSLCLRWRRWPKFTVGKCKGNLLGITMFKQFVYVAFIVKVFKLFYLQFAR